MVIGSFFLCMVCSVGMVTFLRAGVVLPSGEWEERLLATRGLTPYWRVSWAWLKPPTRCLVGTDSALCVWAHVAIVRFKAHDILPAMLVCKRTTSTDSERPTARLSLRWELEKPSCLVECDRLLFFRREQFYVCRCESRPGQQK